MICEVIFYKDCPPPQQVLDKFEKYGQKISDREFGFIFPEENNELRSLCFQFSNHVWWYRETGRAIDGGDVEIDPRRFKNIIAEILTGRDNLPWNPKTDPCDPNFDKGVVSYVHLGEKSLIETFPLI